MSYTETLIWRLDSSAHGAKFEADLEKGADFVRSLGLKARAAAGVRPTCQLPTATKCSTKSGGSASKAA